jgi:hypothetical protein
LKWGIERIRRRTAHKLLTSFSSRTSQKDRYHLIYILRPELGKLSFAH